MSEQLRPTISIIIPTYNGAPTLSKALAAFAASTYPPNEIIVVDDASTDNTREIANRARARVVALETNQGAARAKNRGASVATGDILFFADCDVLVEPDALRRLAERFAEPHLDGIVGVLAAEIPFHNFASQFKNLWMNFTYARLAPEKNVGLFYTSAAAMRRKTFTQLGGFDENYCGASIVEDSEFGQRIWSSAARVIIDPTLAVTHLKRYTFGKVLNTDYLRARALTLLRLRKWGQPFYTSVPWFYQLSVPLLYLLLFTLFFSPLSFSFAVGARWLALFFALLFYLANFALLKFLARRRSLSFALRAALFLLPDVFVVGLGMARAVFDFARGIRY